MAYPPFYSSSTPPYYSTFTTITPLSPNPYTPFASFPNPYDYYGKPESTHPYSQFQPPPPSSPSLPYSQPQPPPSYSPTPCFSHGYIQLLPNHYISSSNPYTPLASLYSQFQPPPPSSPPLPYSQPVGYQNSISSYASQNSFSNPLTPMASQPNRELLAAMQESVREIRDSLLALRDAIRKEERFSDSESLNTALTAPDECLLPTNQIEAPSLNDDSVERLSMADNFFVGSGTQKTGMPLAQLGTETATSPKTRKSINTTAGASTLPPPPASGTSTGSKGTLTMAPFFDERAMIPPSEPPDTNPISSPPPQPPERVSAPHQPPPPQKPPDQSLPVMPSPPSQAFTEAKLGKQTPDMNRSCAPNLPSHTTPPPSDPKMPSKVESGQHQVLASDGSITYSLVHFSPLDRLDCCKERSYPLVTSTVCVLPISVPHAHYSFSKEALSQTRPTPFDASLDGGNKSQPLQESTIRVLCLQPTNGRHMSQSVFPISATQLVTPAIPHGIGLTYLGPQLQFPQQPKIWKAGAHSRDPKAEFVQKEQQKYLLIILVTIGNGQQWDLGGYLDMFTAIKWSQFTQWDPEKFIQGNNFYNLEDKVGLDGVWNDRNNTMG